MKEKTQIEKIIDAIEFKERVKEENLDIIKKKRQDDWNSELEESPYNEYYGLDMKCALMLMKAMKRGLATKDAMYVSEHHFGIPIQRTRDLLYKYSSNGETFYQESTDLERIAYNKERVAKEEKKKNLTLKKEKDY